MRTIGELLGNFFTHKDFLPPADQISGTLFTPLHLIFSLLCIGAVVFGILRASKKGEKTLRAVYGCLWAAAMVLEVSKILWETLSGRNIGFE